MAVDSRLSGVSSPTNDSVSCGISSAAAAAASQINKHNNRCLAECSRTRDDTKQTPTEFARETDRYFLPNTTELFCVLHTPSKTAAPRAASLSMTPYGVVVVSWSTSTFDMEVCSRTSQQLLLQKKMLKRGLRVNNIFYFPKNILEMSSGPSYKHTVTAAAGTKNIPSGKTAPVQLLVRQYLKVETKIVTTVVKRATKKRKTRLMAFQLTGFFILLGTPQIHDGFFLPLCSRRPPSACPVRGQEQGTYPRVNPDAGCVLPHVELQQQQPQPLFD